MKNISEIIGETFASSVKTQIAGDRQHGWGAADSMAVIEDIIAADAKLSADQKKPYSGLSAEAKSYVSRVINPSAARQVFESLKLIDKAPEGSRRSGSTSLAALFKAS